MRVTTIILKRRWIKWYVLLIFRFIIILIFNLISFLCLSHFSSQKQEEKLWRINYDKFMVQFKIEEILKYVEEKFSGRSHEIVKALFSLVEVSLPSISHLSPSPLSSDPHYLTYLLQRNLDRRVSLTPVVTMEALTKELASHPTTSNIPEADLVRYLDLMARFSPPMLNRMGESGFQVSMSSYSPLLPSYLLLSHVSPQIWRTWWKCWGRRWWSRWSMTSSARMPCASSVCSNWRGIWNKRV